MWINLFIWIAVYIYTGFILFSGAEDLIPCEEDWFYFGDKCYKLGGTNITERLNWEQAANKCSSEGGNLATIQSKDVQEFLVTFLLLDAKANAWIGLNDRAGRSVFVWEDGTELHYENWRTYKTQQRNEEIETGKCVEMGFFPPNHPNGLNGKWNYIPCSRNKAYICQIKTSKTLSPDPRFCSDTQGGWKHQNTCYHVVSEKKSWDDAEQHCQDKFNGHLLTVHNFTVDDFVENILSNMEVWIGIKIQEQPLQKWASGWYVSYSEWDKDETQDFVLGTCSVRSKQKLWKKVPCSVNYPFICEAPSVGPPLLKQPVKGAKCPSQGNWLDLDGKYCYYFDTVSKVNWYKANFECVRRGGSLASIHSDEESVTLQQFINYNQTTIHIGLLRHVESKLEGLNVFIWADGSHMDYKNWNWNDPSTENALCGGMLIETMRWYGASCDTQKGYICSVRKVSANTTEQTDCPVFTVSPNVRGQKVCPSDVTCKVLIGLFICTLLVANLIGCLIYGIRTARREKRRKKSSSAPLHPPVPSSQRESSLAKEDDV